jgi:hypothetical protein
MIMNYDHYSFLKEQDDKKTITILALLGCIICDHGNIKHFLVINNLMTMKMYNCSSKVIFKNDN